MSAANQFVGRSLELRQFDELLDTSFHDRGRLLLISGEAGVGKTTLGLKFRALAQERDLVTSWVSLPEQADCPPYWAWIQMCRQLHDFGYGTQVEKLELYLSRTVSPEFETNAFERDRNWVFAELVKLLGEVSKDSQFVLFIDNLHCSDAATGALLRLIAGSLSDVPILLVASYRDAEDAQYATGLRTATSLAASPFCSRMPLKGMDTADCAQLTHALSGWRPEPKIVARLQRQTEGNPLFIHHIVQSLIDQGHLRDGKAKLPPRLTVPEGIREAISLKLRRASGKCLDLLQDAAVLGRRFDTATLERMSHEYDAMLIDEACELGVLQEIDATLGRWQFAHSLIREVLYERIPPMRRLRAHADAARCLEELYGNDQPGNLSALAYHSFEGQQFVETPRVIALSLKAARHAQSIAAHEDAIRHFQLALDCYSVPGLNDNSGRIDTALELAAAQRASGEMIAAMQTCRKVIEWSRSEDDWERHSRAALLFEAARWQPSLPSSESISYLNQSLAHCVDGEAANVARLHYSLARAYLWEGAAEKAALHGAEGVKFARELDDPALLCDALEHAAGALSIIDALGERIRITQEHLQIARELGDLPRIAAALTASLVHFAYAGRFDEIWGLVEELKDVADVLAQPHFQYIAGQSETMKALLEGDFQKAIALANDGVAIGRRIHGANVDGIFGIQMFLINRERGLLGGFAQLAMQTGKSDPASVWKPGLALLLAEAGETEEANAILAETEKEGLASIPKDAVWLVNVAFLAEASVIVGNLRLAYQLHKLLKPSTGNAIICGPSSGCFGPVDRLLGRLQAVLGRFDLAEPLFERALEQAQEWNSPPTRCRIMCDFAEALIEQGTPAAIARARELELELSDALATVGMRGLASRQEQISRKLRSLATSHGFDRLTGREIEVLRELTLGSSNAEISANLGI